MISAVGRRGEDRWFRMIIMGIEGSSMAWAHPFFSFSAKYHQISTNIFDLVPSLHEEIALIFNKMKVFRAAMESC